ncbi:MAG TPA: GPW/gp25 family protein [Gemmatimonadaceae bacterium]|nr:GPW/gp25 family protein [Gemmatimonadaceae bacterium]
MNIDFPLHFTELGHSADATVAEHVRDMLELLLLTSPGERVNRPDFGSGLLQHLFAPNSLEVATALEFTTRAALQRWLGDLVEVLALSFTADDSRLFVELQYVIRETGERRSEAFELANTT